MTIIIPPEFEGRTLRSYLKFTLTLSTAVIARLKNHERGMIVNGERVTVRCVLHAGDVLEIADRDTAENATENVVPVDLPLEVLYEDEHVIALSKPANMPTHPSHGHLCDTLANALAYRYEQKSEPFVFRPLGRLDRNTSGVVVAAKTRAVSGTLSQALRRGDVRKRYLAILEGRLPVDEQTHDIIAPIHRPQTAGSILRAVCSEDTEGADHAHTRFRVLAASDTHSLVLAEPVTGRTHQLRVHFAHIGHPITGDELYGQVSHRIGRHALHALSLSVPLPYTRATGTLSAEHPLTMNEIDPQLPLNAPTPDGYLHTWAPLPTDMAMLIDTLFSADFALPTHPTVGDLHPL